MSSTRFTVYQLDFQSVASGKRVASTKRRVRWRFGFANQQAIESGLSGIDCRGEEHEIEIIWSLTSGKRYVKMNGNEVHFSIGRAGVLDHSWASRGNHVFKVIAYATPPITPVPGFRQYDFLIDGQSFFYMPKVYELGLRRPSAPGYERNPGVNYARSQLPDSSGYPSSRIRAPPTREEEEAELQRAIKASLDESRQYLERNSSQNNGRNNTPLALPAPVPERAQDLLEFGGNNSPNIITAYPSSDIPYTHYNTSNQTGQQFPQLQNGPSNISPSFPSGSFVPPPHSLPPVTVGVEPAYGHTFQPPQHQPSYPDSSANVYAPPASTTFDAFAPAPAQSDVFNLYQPTPFDDPFAPKPPPPKTHDDIANTILGAYGNSPDVTLSENNPNIQLMLGNGPSHMPDSNFHAQSADSDTQPIDEVNSLMQKLTNFDRIDEPRTSLMSLDMKKREEEKEKEKMKNRGKSIAIPPVSKGVVGSGATLDQIKTTKPGKNQAPSENIMKPAPQLSHPNVAMAGALVVHGQHPPPLQQQGFGQGYQSFGYR